MFSFQQKNNCILSYFVYNFYQPNIMSIALFTIPVLRFGAVGLAITSDDPCAFLYAA